MREGFSYVAKRFSKASNKYMKSNDDNTVHILMQIIYMVG